MPSLSRLRPPDPRAAALVLALSAAACTQFPELDAAQGADVADAPYPALVPIDRILDGPAPVVDSGTRAGVDGRADALRARAAGLRGDIVDADTRRRMSEGVARSD